jgi:putative RecB family exonuclease
MTDAVHLPVFRNEHLSISRLGKYEQCALAFYYQYVNPPEGLVRTLAEPAEFGTVLHAALERLYQWIIDTEYEGAFPEGELLEHFRVAWSESGLNGISLYQEGRDILRQYVTNLGTVDHMRVLAVEQEFNLLLCPDGSSRLVPADEKERWSKTDDHYVVNGYIDRVDRLGPGTVGIIDYKSNRQLFSKEELEDSLQMSVYSLAAQKLYPWARRIELSFEMLRHGIRQFTKRTDEELRAAHEYVRSLGARTERGPYPPTLNTYCGTCDHRTRCDAYESALTKQLELVKVSTSDLASLAAEYDRVTKIAKAAYARQKTLEDILKAAIGEEESLQLGSVVYRLEQYFSTTYPVEPLLALFKEVGVDSSSLLRIDNGALDAVLEKVETDETLPKTVRDLFRVRVAAKAVKLPQRPRLQARKKKP